jgi:hypothetical protein
VKSLKNERLERIRKSLAAFQKTPQEDVAHWKSQKDVLDDIEFLLSLVPAGIDHQIDSVEEQRIVDRRRIEQAAKIIGSPVSLEQAIDFAINWCVTALQETCNADYWKERAQAAERLLAITGTDR